MNLKYFNKRLEMLKAIKINGQNKPMSVFTRKIVSPGSELTKVTEDLASCGAIKKVNVGREVRTSVTPKGERLICLIEELNEVCNGD